MRAGLSWAWLMVGAMAFAQGPTRSERGVSRFGERYDGFLLLCSDRQMELATLQELRSTAKNELRQWTLMLLGDAPNWRELEIDPSEFVRQGGSLLVARDRGMTIPLGRPPTFQILNGPLRSTEPTTSYRGNPACPVVTEFKRDHPLMRGVDQLVLNLPGVFAGGDSRDWGISFLPKSLNVRLYARSWLLAGELGTGRFVASSDQSIFTNEMIQEADNTPFADNVVAWLLEKKGPGERRLACVANGVELKSLLDERFVSGEWSKRPPASEVLNELLRGLEAEDVPNELAREAQASLSQANPWFVRQIGMIVLGSVMGALLVYRILGAREMREALDMSDGSDDAWRPALDRSVLTGLPRADQILEQRSTDLRAEKSRREWLRREAARALDEFYGSARWRESASPMALSATGWQGWRQARLVRRIRAFALRSSQQRIGARKYRFWKSEIQKLDTITKLNSTGRVAMVESFFVRWK